MWANRRDLPRRSQEEGLIYKGWGKGRAPIGPGARKESVTPLGQEGAWETHRVPKVSQTGQTLGALRIL